VAQFDVYKAPRGGDHSHLVDVQSDSLSQMESRVVVPMIARRKLNPKELVPRLNPTATIDGIEYVLIVQELAAVSTSLLRERVGTVLKQRDELIAAVDLLFTGI
jgi:toxin CcdB